MPVCLTCGNDLAEGVRYCPSCGAEAAAVELAMATAGDGPQLRLALFPRRAAGLLIDVGIVVVIGFIPFVWLFIFVLGPGAWLVFNSIGWSPGKRLLGMRIVQEDGSRPGFGRAAARTFTAPQSLTLFGLGFLWPLWDDERQTWHDKFSGTHVVLWDDAVAAEVRDALDRSAAENTPGGPFGDSSRTMPAEFMVRWGGYLIDFWCYLALAFPLAIPLWLIAFPDLIEVDRDPTSGEQVLGNVLYLVAMTIPLAFFNARGWSPGKRSLALRLVDPDGRHPGARRGTVRALGSLLSHLLVGIPLGYLWALWDEDGRTRHDTMADTQVLQRIPRRPARWS